MCACDISYIRMLIELRNAYLQSHFARKKECETNYPPRTLRFIRIFVILSNPLFNYLQFTDAWPGSESRDQHPFKAATSRQIYLLSMVQNSDTELSHVGTGSSKPFFHTTHFAELIAWVLTMYWDSPTFDWNFYLHLKLDCGCFHFLCCWLTMPFRLSQWFDLLLSLNVSKRSWLLVSLCRKLQKMRIDL